MQYSREVEEMFCVAKGAKHDPAPIPEEGKHIRPDPRRGLVRAAAGRLQADAEHKGRHN